MRQRCLACGAFTEQYHLCINVSQTWLNVRQSRSIVEAIYINVGWTGSHDEARAITGKHESIYCHSGPFQVYYLNAGERGRPAIPQIDFSSEAVSRGQEAIVNIER